MSTLTIVLIIVAAALVGVALVLYFLGKRAQKKQDEQNEIVERTAQPVSMLIIDKKRMRMKDSGLPPEVAAQVPKYLRLSKFPIVKAKVGPRMTTLICDPAVFEELPIKKEIKAMVSGIYISSFKGLHGKYEAPVKKKGLRAKLLNFARNNRQ